MNTKVHDRFIEAFQWTGLTSNGLAVQLNMNARTIWNYTDNGKDPSIKCVMQMCKVFEDLNFDYIMYGEGSLLKYSKQSMFKDEDVSEEVPAQENTTEETVLQKIESIYKEMISTLKEQLKATNDRCTSLEEQNKILLSLIPKDRKEE